MRAANPRREIRFARKLRSVSPSAKEGELFDVWVQRMLKFSMGGKSSR
jgi:hypothetical protein